MQITTIGLDLAKSVFQVHGVDAAGHNVIKKKLRRAEVLKFFEALPPCLVGIEACATAHHWARKLSVLGHEVRLMPPAYVKAYVRRQKNDAADAEAICEAVTRPRMRFAEVESPDSRGPAPRALGAGDTSRGQILGGAGSGSPISPGQNGRRGMA